MDTDDYKDNGKKNSGDKLFFFFFVYLFMNEF